MTHVYRCIACNNEFEAPKDTVACPQCGAENSAQGTVVVRLACIHLDDKSQKTVKRTCCTGEPWRRRGLLATPHCLSVTCPRCKETEAYRTALVATNEDRLHDVPESAHGTR